MNKEPEPCEKDCIMNLIDPPCEKCQAWYQYWADIDSSDEPALPQWIIDYVNESDKECPDPDCICKKDNNVE